MTKISIVIPAYNSESCLGETLNSALAQTHPAHEIVVIDDGSTDRTEEIARSYGKDIRYIRQENQGIAGARNTAIQHATGEWIAFLDHDDIMLPMKLEKQLAVIESKPDLVAVYSAFTFLYPDGSTRVVPAFPAKDLWPALRYRTPILPSTAIIRRSALLEVGGFRKLYCTDDWDLWFRLVRRYSCKAFQEIPESLVLYRWWENNASQKFMPIGEQVLDMLEPILLDGLTGLERKIWKRKIEAKVFYNLSVSLRDNGNARYWEYAIASMLKWPLWGDVVTIHRYRVVIHMILTRLRNFQFKLRYWWPVRRCNEGLAKTASISPPPLAKS